MRRDDTALRSVENCSHRCRVIDNPDVTDTAENDRVPTTVIIEGPKEVAFADPKGCQKFTCRFNALVRQGWHAVAYDNYKQVPVSCNLDVRPGMDIKIIEKWAGYEGRW